MSQLETLMQSSPLWISDDFPSITYSQSPRPRGGGVGGGEASHLLIWGICFSILCPQVHDGLAHHVPEGAQLVSFLKRKKKRNQEAGVGSKDRKREEL